MRSLKESILSDIETTLNDGDNTINELKHIYNSCKLCGVAGVSNNAEKLFNEINLDKYCKYEFKSEIMRRKFGYYKSYSFLNCKNFAKWLETLTLKDLNISSFHIKNMSDAENLAKEIERFAKKEGVLKKNKNIQVKGMYFDDKSSGYFTRGQLQIYVRKLDKENNVVKTKSGNVELLYVFDCK